jgi:hypothetical protein
MLRPICAADCSPALAACQKLMQRLALCLCDPATTAASLTQAGLQPPVMPTDVEANWLWSFLQKKQDRQTLLDCARMIAAMPAQKKAALAAWVQTVAALHLQFQGSASSWPLSGPSLDKVHWSAFKVLMTAFYSKGFIAGLPYKPDGTPVSTGGVDYPTFVEAFRAKHRSNTVPNLREVCVFCGGRLGAEPHVDHWISKSEFPLLSICADNLTLICSDCNEAPNKGAKAVHSAGSFADWFHPYLRPGHGSLRLVYEPQAAAVNCSAACPPDLAKAANLDSLLDLSKRWTGEFKAKYAEHQKVLLRREENKIRSAQPRHTLQDLQAYVDGWANDLESSNPDYEVHSLLGQAMREPARIDAWLTELAQVH